MTNSEFAARLARRAIEATTVVLAVVNLLDDLGSTADQVADRLRALGVKGHRNACWGCPIAEYLLRSDLNPCEVLIGDTTASIIFGDRADPDQLIEIRLPEPVQMFINRFDAGVYLDLVAIPAVTR